MKKMNEEKTGDFITGDVILHQGEAYQVYENLGSTGRVAPFPGDKVQLIELEWDEHCRKIGHEPLPGPTPCSAGKGCPSNK